MDYSPAEKLLVEFTVRTDWEDLLSCTSLLSDRHDGATNSMLTIRVAYRGCVVFGRVAGDEAAAYTMQGISSGKIANERLNQVGQHLGMATTIKIDPTTKKVTLEFNWDDNGVISTAGVAAPAAQAQAQAVEQKKVDKKKKVEKEEVQKVEQKEYTMEEVAQHNKKDDCWVVIGGQVLDATTFLSDRSSSPFSL